MESLLLHAESALNGLFAISPAETLFAARGFAPAEPGKQRRLEAIGAIFVEGYNTALKGTTIETLAQILDRLDPERRGFAYEGAAMALALTDQIWRTRPARWERFLLGAGALQKYMLYVGYGWATARLPWLRNRLTSVLSRHHALEKWLILDGYGFHEGYFHPVRTFVEQKRPKQVTGLTAQAFDQGVGRSVWFCCGADVDRVAGCIEKFHAPRRADLWSGVALAATYAGGASRAELLTLREHASGFEKHLAQGCAFAAQARLLGRIDVPHTSAATEIFAGMDAREAAAATELALNSIPGDRKSYSAYEQWRAAIREIVATKKLTGSIA